MHRKLAVYSMFALFGCAYATLDRIPQRAAQVLRGSVEQIHDISAERRTSHFMRRSLQ
jgi:hypothetical protein